MIKPFLCICFCIVVTANIKVAIKTKLQEV
nr:MAG TPA: hypothetical protein [Caudoviricetes sp.]